MMVKLFNCSICQHEYLHLALGSLRHDAHKDATLSPTSPVLYRAPDFDPAGPPLLSALLVHCPSPCDLWSSRFPSSFRLPLHYPQAVIVLLLSEHMTNPVPSCPLRISSLILFTPFISDTVLSTFRTGCGYHIHRIFLKHVNWNLSSFFSFVLWFPDRHQKGPSCFV